MKREEPRLWPMATRPDTFFVYSVYTPKDPVALERVFS